MTPQNCWEFHNCVDATRDKCPAFPNDGRKCWEVASTFDGSGCPKVKGVGMKYCVLSCAWFKKIFKRPGDK
jgi:hypothetical protein